MFDLDDLVPLPILEPRLDQIVADGSGVCLVVGPNPPLAVTAAVTTGFLPSGRSTILRLLMRRMLAYRPGTQAIVLTPSKEAVRLPRSMRHRVQILVAEPTESPKELVSRAMASRPGLLVMDELAAGAIAQALEAGQRGLCVLAQLNSIFRGSEVLRQLEEMGVPQPLLGAVHWIVAVQRLPALCAACREPASVRPEVLAGLRDRGISLEPCPGAGSFFQSGGCDRCGHTGRSGEVTVFDILNTDPTARDRAAQQSRLSLESYMLALAVEGYVSIEDLLSLNTDRLRRTYAQLTATEHTLTDALTSLKRREAELEAANRVLQQRTSVLIALEGIGQALTSATTLYELAAQLCRCACDLCGADRSILYYLRPESQRAEVLAVWGWDAAMAGQSVEAAAVLDALRSGNPHPHNEWPPGILRRPTDVTAAALRAGMCVPLIAQDARVGLMVVHTSRRSRFQPGDVALLQTFANQAAVAIQRSGLIEALLEKVTLLETAQAELVQKERLERELELARQVQQSVLPRQFPAVRGYQFAAHSLPARQVGGDFYDVILVRGGQEDAAGPAAFMLVIGDVSDKGMPAALYMALTRSLILAEARHLTAGNAAIWPSPRSLLTNVHRLLLELGQPSMFVTTFVGLVDGPSGRMTYACAGQDRPILLRNRGARFLDGEGTVLGFPGVEELFLSEEQVTLLPGDRLVLYTDGLTDTSGPEGHRFGISRLVSLLDAHRGLPTDEVCPCVFGELAAFRGTTAQYDDMTLLVVDVSELKAGN